MAEQYRDARNEPGHSRDNVKLEPSRDESGQTTPKKSEKNKLPPRPEPQADGAGV